MFLGVDVREVKVTKNRAKRVQIEARDSRRGVQHSASLSPRPPHATWRRVASVLAVTQRHVAVRKADQHAAWSYSTYGAFTYIHSTYMYM